MSDIQGLADRIAIRDLVDRYSFNVTRRAWKEVGDCFHLESSWQVAAPFNMGFHTRDGIVKGISGAVETLDFLVQMSTSVVIEDLTTDRARTSVVVGELSRNTSNHTGSVHLGVYTDTVTKIDGNWAFESRSFQSHYLDTAWLPGQVLIDYSRPS